MTMSETIDFLDAIKAYFPASYRNFSPQDAKAVCVVWLDAFADVPFDIMLMALKLYKDHGKFAPSVAEIREALASIHYETDSFLRYPPFLRKLSRQEITKRERIRSMTAPFSGKTNANDYLLPTAREQMLLDSIEF